MKIDLLHSKVIKDNITQAFIESFSELLVPALENKYGAELVSVQMYEDCLCDGFVYEDEFYYPLTLVFSEDVKREWIKWSVLPKKSFESGVPYAYTGSEPLDIKIADFVPAGFEDRLSGRGVYFEGGYAPLKIESAISDKVFLAGKYSQTFIDEMTRQISRQIEKAFSVSGISDSTLELTLAFSPDTYMEHVSECSTYRRLLISARGCSARDLWIRWYKKDGSGTLTVSDNAGADEVTFEICEDVPQKIREKEYRYLVRTSADKYQSSMGRKNITEWRELIKRVIKRGELAKLEIVEEDIEKDSELAFKLQEVLSGYNTASAPSETTVENSDNSDITALLKGVLGVEEDTSVNEEYVEEDGAFVSDGVDEFSEISDEDEEQGEDKNESAEAEDENEESYEEALRRRLEAEIREKLELEAKMKADEETLNLRRAHEELKAENERLADMARRAEEEKLAFCAEKEAESERLRLEIEARERAETIEKERMAEAARLALIEQQRIMEERALEERRREEEDARIRAEQLRIEEEARIAEQRRIEAERIRAEMEAQEKQVEKEASRTEVELPKAPARPKYTYVSKVAKLLFRYPVDPNVTKRIHEIILTTIKYFHKEDVYIKIKATVPDSTTVNLYFEKIPQEENELLINIIKVLGKSELGITKVYLE
ncbi:MAG: hypothetical protein IJW38_05665 [Clostridia bacterium]|nr:hypothetical protein [Clostridia bacterium]